MEEVPHLVPGRKVTWLVRQQGADDQGHQAARVLPGTIQVEDPGPGEAPSALSLVLLCHQIERVLRCGIETARPDRASFRQITRIRIILETGPGDDRPRAADLI